MGLWDARTQWWRTDALFMTAFEKLITDVMCVWLRDKEISFVCENIPVQYIKESRIVVNESERSPCAARCSQE